MRYFFDLEDGVTHPDMQGTELANDAAARQEAILRALSQKQSCRLQTYNGCRSISLRDETGRIICEVPIDD